VELAAETRALLMAKLDELAERHRELEQMLGDQEVTADSARLAGIAQEHSYLSKLLARRDALRKVQGRRREGQELLQEEPEDEELRELARQEIERADRDEDQLLEEVVQLLVSDERAGERNVIVEIRAGTGGEEAALFAADLFGMYGRYAEKQGWSVELMDSSATDLGGMREVVFSVSGRGAWRKVSYESGGHRVQRVPKTESQGRIHTSLATVAVLPEAKEVEVQIDPSDIEMSFMRSSGPGGQHVNKTSSCVRLVHKPTGITVRCQDEKSQRANRKKAMKILRARLYEAQMREQQERRDALRRSQVGSGDRNERIRTYNFPQDRVTDHRIGLDIFGVEGLLMGNCDRLFDALAEHDRQERVRELVESGALPSPTESG
jgi:peptide chain release factor 1